MFLESRCSPGNTPQAPLPVEVHAASQIYQNKTRTDTEYLEYTPNNENFFQPSYEHYSHMHFVAIAFSTTNSIFF